MKLPNGHGTVYRIGAKSKNPPRRRNPWVARITTGFTDEGKQLYQTIGYFATRQEALDALTLHRINPLSPRANITLEELYKEWSAVKYKQVTPATVNNYKSAWNHIKKLAHLKVKDLRTAQLQGVIDKSTLGSSSLEKIRVVMVMLFSYAIENDILNKSYAEFVKLPKKRKTEKERFSDTEIQKLSKNPDEWTSTILIMIYTGMRISELLGLTRFNVDLERGIITGGIKTDAGENRVIPIHPKILPYIKMWYDKQGEALICENGKKLHPKTYSRKHYHPALERAGVRRLTPHACRHTFCSMLADAGADTLAIKLLAGHTEYSFTANEYTHPEIEFLKKAISKI
jgi:integrase